MIMHGLVDEGVAVVGAVRQRHNGARRNPFNDIECGSYYARSMSAWQLVNAWGGFSADQVDGVLSFSPKSAGDYRVFWSSGTAWGELARQGEALSLRVLGGDIGGARIVVDGKTYDAGTLTAGQTLEPV